MFSNSFLREKEHSKYLETDKISNLALLDIMLYNVCLVVKAFFHSCLKYNSLISSKAGQTRKKWNSSSTIYTLRFKHI